MVIRTRVAGWTRTRQSIELHMSIGKLDKIIRRLKVKYDHAAMYDPILPPRKASAEETYMDEH